LINYRRESWLSLWYPEILEGSNKNYIGQHTTYGSAGDRSPTDRCTGRPPTDKKEKKIKETKNDEREEHHPTSASPSPEPKEPDPTPPPATTAPDPVASIPRWITPFKEHLSLGDLSDLVKLSDGDPARWEWTCDRVVSGYVIGSNPFPLLYQIAKSYKPEETTPQKPPISKEESAHNKEVMTRVASGEPYYGVKLVVSGDELLMSGGTAIKRLRFDTNDFVSCFNAIAENLMTQNQQEACLKDRRKDRGEKR